MPGAITFERVQSIAGRHPQIVELRHRVDLIQLASVRFLIDMPGPRCSLVVDGAC
jgi:hypothetical protein